MPRKKKPKLSNCYIIDIGPTIRQLQEVIEESVEDEDYEHAAMCKELIDLYNSKGKTFNQIVEEQVTILKKHNRYEPI